MEVFVLMSHDIIDFDDYSRVKVFSTEEKAKAELKRSISRVKKSIKGEKWEVETESDTEFFAYKENCYAGNRFREAIYKVEVE